MGGRGLLRRLTAPAVALSLLPLFPNQRRPVPVRDPAPQQQDVAGPHQYYNPVWGGVFADPMVLRNGRHDYYAYSTTNSRRDIYPILHSRDLMHWRKVGNAFRRPPRWSYTSWWAPSVLRRNGTYYLFYVGQARRPRKLCVAVATASRPKGPFRHRARIACAGYGGSIDPAPLVDRGRVYLYFARTGALCRWKPGRCSIQVVRLRRDLLGSATRARRVLDISLPWESSDDYAAIENPWVVRSQGLYYLLYSGNDWNADYAMGYAVSRSPTGPFSKPQKEPLLAGREGLTGPGGGSVVKGPRGRLWLLYHGRRNGSGLPPTWRRSLNIDPLLLNHGRMAVVGPSLTSRVRP
jgi:beta-xylosidase